MLWSQGVHAGLIATHGKAGIMFTQFFAFHTQNNSNISNI